MKVRATDAERAEWPAKARSAGLTLSGLVRRALGRVRPWSVAHADVERELTRELVRIGNNLNRVARWANTHKGGERPSRSSPALSPSSGRSRRWLAWRARTPMHIKFLAHGTGSARAPADYLLGPRDAVGKPREGVEVLRGDPSQVATMAGGDGRSSFAFALPAQPRWADQLASITLSGPSGSVTLDRNTNRPVTIQRNPRNGQIRGILRDRPDAPRGPR